jgi:predicted Rossmann-fold nucleotide-binding protein
MKRIPLKTVQEVRDKNGQLTDTVSQDIDLTQIPEDYWRDAQVKDAYFLGCDVGAGELERLLRSRGATIIPRVAKPIYDPYRSGLYTQDELASGYQAGKRTSLDERIFDQYVKDDPLKPDIIEALARRIHDFSIDTALEDLLDKLFPKPIVGVMGGSSRLRTDAFYAKVATLAQSLTQQGFFVVTGGGPGMMEAANFGAYMANYSPNELEDALTILGKHPDPKDEAAYIQAALDVRTKYPNGDDSLGIPTWFYGHEPTSRFSRSIAKYFSNSIREGGLISICLDGLIFVPGSAGTGQEIFMDAAQNYYGTYGCYSPMVFFGVRRYTAETSLYKTVLETSNGHYRDLIALCEEADEVVAFLKKTKRVPVPKAQLKTAWAPKRLLRSMGQV